MKILITGHRGFIGSHFVQHYADHTVVGLDVRTGRDVRDGLPLEAFDLAIHCAANVGGRVAIDNQQMWVAANLGIDLAFLQWAADMWATRVVLFSSSAAYPVALQRGTRTLHEDDIDLENLTGQPDASYGWAKLSLERLAQWARPDALILRPFSGYSHDQSTDYPFTALLDRVRRQLDPLPIWSDTVRDFIHVEDVIGAVSALLDHGQTGPFNLSTGVATSFSTLARMMAEQAGYSPSIKVLGEHPGVSYRVGSPAKLAPFYTPRVTIEQGIRRGLCRD